MSIIQAKQAQPIYRSRTVLAVIASVLSVVVASVLVESVPMLADRDETVFIILFSGAGAVIGKYLMTDVMGMLSDIISIIFEDGELNLKDVTNIIGELLLDDNGLNAEQVEVVKDKMIEKGYKVENGVVELTEDNYG